MTKETKLPLEEFEKFKSEKERALLKWFVIGDLSFLIASLILMLIAEGVLKLGALNWNEYWILFIGNLLLFVYALFSLAKNFKVWLLKYLIAIFGPVIGSTWIYFTDPKYTKVMLGSHSMMLILILGFLFFEFKVVLLSALIMSISLGALLFHYLKIGTPFSLYEIYLLYLFLFMAVGFSFPLVQRIRLFLTELLQKRREAEEAKSVLEIKVKARTKELEELTKSLDQKVKERTKELQERINELEKFHKLTIGRELRMVELKKEIEKKEEEIERLKEQLKKKVNIVRHFKGEKQ